MKEFFNDQQEIHSVGSGAKTPVWIKDTLHLQQKITLWCQKPWLAIDTEFIRTDTFYPKPALIQICDGESSFLIDPLSISDLTVMKPVLENKQTLKIMHSMSEDVELLKKEVGAVPRPVFDTQVAAAFLGMGASLGYQTLVFDQLNIRLDKSETRSDWMQRPLTSAQIDYALQDIDFLYPLYQKLRILLLQQKKYDWVVEEGECLCLSSELSQHTELPHHRFKNLSDWPHWKQRLLAGLLQWRELRSHETDKPRSWVISDQQMTSILNCLDRLPEVSTSSLDEQFRGWCRSLEDGNNITALLRCAGLKASQVSQNKKMLAETIKSLLEKEYHHSEDDNFFPIPAPLKGEKRKLYKQLRTQLEQKADSSGISASLISSKRLTEVLFRRGIDFRIFKLPEEWASWRRDIILPVWQNWLSQALPVQKSEVSTVTNKMKKLISVYRSLKKAEMYLYLNKSDSFDHIPENLMLLFGSPIKVMDMILTPSKKLARVDVNTLLADINEKGYFLQMPPADEDNLLQVFRKSQGLMD